ncbi:hypothetical protein Q4Q39_12395 [Flavivirga amylovorans]|uniref:Uncharacterized protein n=1 Tax=Flavivirga amylovorans TaxID=870486 RepID=A0ABT8X2S1_9FLAO|nr:hypothetical protein [Flavivirga amylovorans]MDO5988206.1 hypothetical protein [Flavivirga amylovorans]
MLKRKRISKEVRNIEVIEDPLEFKPNCASKNAQCIHKYDELKVELWCDKHYHQRRTFGDSKGKREGIEVDGVQELIIDAFKYLLDIYLRGVQFKFINFFDPKKPNNVFNRIVIKKPIGDNVLNVVAEIHYLETSKFEITVITAMAISDFKVADGQYSLTIADKSVVLRRNIRKVMNEIYRVDI